MAPLSIVACPLASLRLCDPQSGQFGFHYIPVWVSCHHGVISCSVSAHHLLSVVLPTIFKMPPAPHRVCNSPFNEGQIGMEVCAVAFEYTAFCTRSSHLQVDTVAWEDAVSVASSLNVSPRIGVDDPMEVSRLIHASWLSPFRV